MAHKYYPWIAAALVSVMLFAGCGKKAGDTSSADSSGVTNGASGRVPVTTVRFLVALLVPLLFP